MQIVKTTEEIQQAIIDTNISTLQIRECSICGVMMHYLFRNGQIFADTNCNCVTYTTHPTFVPIEDFADYYNRNQPVNNPNISPEWVGQINKALGFTDLVLSEIGE